MIESRDDDDVVFEEDYPAIRTMFFVLGVVIGLGLGLYLWG